MQSVLRNPLAEPFLLGISSGAALGAVFFLLMGQAVPGGQFLFAFLGGMITLFLVLALSKKKGEWSVTRVILTGVIVNAFFTSFIMFIMATTTDELLHTILYWLYGDLSSARYREVVILLIALVLCFCAIYASID